MSKILKILIMLFIILLMINTIVCATDINMNLSNESNNPADTNSISDSNIINDGTNSEQNSSNTLNSGTDNIGGAVAPSGVNSIAQENMSFSNILNILVITVGVILILLAVAILIRLKG